MRVDVFDLRDRLEKAGHRNQVVPPDPNWNPWTRARLGAEVEAFNAVLAAGRCADGGGHIRVFNRQTCIWCGKEVTDW